VHNLYSRRSHTTQPQPCMQIVVKVGLTVAWSDSVRKTSGQWCSAVVISRRPSRCGWSLLLQGKSYTK